MQIPCSVVPNNQYDKIKRQRPAAGVEACLYPADYTACMCAHPSTTYCIKAVKAVKHIQEVSMLEEFTKLV